MTHHTPEPSLRDRDARHLICFDACEGIPTDQLQPGSVKALVEALNATLSRFRLPKVLERDACIIIQARAALAPFKEKTEWPSPKPPSPSK